MDNISSQNELVKSFFGPCENGRYKCKLCDNHPGIKGTVSNLKDHLNHKHKSTADSLNLVPQKKRKSSESKSLITITNFQVDLNEIRRGILLFVVDKFISFRAFDSEGFKLAFSDLLAEIGVKINRNEIKKLILFASEKLRLLLIDLLKNKMISIMYDGASRHNRSVFGVKAQFIEGKEVRVVGLGAVTMSQRHTAVNYNLEVKALVENVNKSLADVYSTTSDTAKVMIKLSQLIQEAQQQYSTFELFVDDNEDLDFDQPGSDPLGIFGDIFDANHHNSNEDVVSTFHPGNIFVGQSQESISSIIHCGVHVLQLAAHDVSDNFKHQFDIVRKLVKECKKAEHRDLFREAQLAIPVLDTEPRWDTQYSMCDSVLKLQEALRSFSSDKLKLTDDTWDFVKTFSAAFLPVHIATKELQRRNLLIGEFDVYLFSISSKFYLIQLKETSTLCGH